MSWRRAAAKTPGWAAFDLKKQQQNGGDDSSGEQAAEGSPYPLQLMSTNATRSKGLPHTAGAVQNNGYIATRGRSFVSVLLPNDNMEFPALPASSGSRSSSSGGQSSTTQQSRNEFNHESDSDIVQHAVAASCSTKLKELYGWADESLIADVMTAVDNDVNKASPLLAAMSSLESSIERWQKADKSVECSNVDKGGISFEKESADIEEVNHLRGKGGVNYAADEEFCYDYDLSCRGEDSGNDAAAEMKVDLACWKKMVPAEPEWKEDDIYSVHRKEALHMTRSASRHSRAATYAYIRGDHFSAQQFSAKAREEWAAAERLNAKAAKKILSIRNGENGLWKLDLHGLHASEAVQALQERLNKLESLVPSDRSLSPNGRNSSSKRTGGGNSTVVRCASLESLTRHVNKVKLDEESFALSSSFPQRRPASLHVITGMGNHSRGQAALPTAIRNFLDENGYRYDEARPGLITVRPKFRL